MTDEDRKPPEELTDWTWSDEAKDQEPREMFQRVSHIAISMSYDLIDKLRFFEKETLKLPDNEINKRVPHLAAFLERLKAAYLDFAEVDF